MTVAKRAVSQAYDLLILIITVRNKTTHYIALKSISAPDLQFC